MRYASLFGQCCTAALCTFATIAFAAQPAATDPAQSYSTKPIRLVTAATSGSGPEVVARHIAAKLSEAWGQQVVVDPRPGATGMISAEIVAKSAPDGYTLWFATSTQLLGSMMFQRNFMTQEYAPIGMLSVTAFALAVNSSVPAATLGEFIAHAKARPGKLLFASNRQGLTSRERRLPLGAEPAPATPAEFAARLHAETTKWAKLMKDANIQPTQ